MKLKKSIRLEEKIWNEVAKHAEMEGISQTEYIESVLLGATQSATHVPPSLPPTCHPGDTIENEDWKKLYFSEKKRNEDLSDRLMDLSSKVADTFQAEKLIEATDRAGTIFLESKDQKEARNKSRWQRLVEAWRG